MSVQHTAKFGWDDHAVDVPENELERRVAEALRLGRKFVVWVARESVTGLEQVNMALKEANLKLEVDVKESDPGWKEYLQAAGIGGVFGGVMGGAAGIGLRSIATRLGAAAVPGLGPAVLIGGLLGAVVGATVGVVVVKMRLRIRFVRIAREEFAVLEFAPT